MIDRVRQWLASGPRDDTAEIQAEAARIRAGWVASKPPVPVRSLVPAATTPVAVPPAPVMGAGGVAYGAGGAGSCGGGGYVQTSYPFTPGGIVYVSSTAAQVFATSFGGGTGGWGHVPIDPIYTIPPTQQWREQYTQALESARYGRVVREE